jgi:hypothetical protein
MTKSLVALGTATVLGAATLTTSNPAAAQPWLLPVIAGTFLTGAFVGAAAASPYPYYYPYDSGYNGYGYNGYGYNGYGYNGYGYNGYGYPCYHHCQPYYPAYYGGYGPTVVIVTPHY